MDNTYYKDFDGWNTAQKRIDAQLQPTTQFHEREIWWASLGINIGREIDGKGVDHARPILIFKKFSRDTLWIIPISNTSKTGTYFHNIKVRTRDNTVILIQMRLISAKRLLKKIGKLDAIEFAQIVQKMRNLLP